jgi:tetraacyldisaccharide 4'-kinase
MKVYKVLLFPFAILFDIVTRVRNRLYNQGLRPSAQFDLPVISVGNLTVGGTGKTPMIEHLIRLLAPAYTIATLSRGYGRSTKGIRIASDNDDASSIGDEPYQLYKKFHHKVTVLVGEERALAIPYLLHERAEVQVVLLDDAFQHRKVKPSFQILLTDYNHPFYSDFLLPAGRLRESRTGASRADAIVVTKCPPALKDDEKIILEKTIRTYSDSPVFFSAIRYGVPVAFNSGSVFSDDAVILVSGLANASPLEDVVKRNYKMVKHLAFVDHHRYSQKDMELICQEAKLHGASVLTSEKDAVKMNSHKFENFMAEASFFYLPIEIEFLKNGQDFDQMVINVVKNA